MKLSNIALALSIASFAGTIYNFWYASRLVRMNQEYNDLIKSHPFWSARQISDEVINRWPWWRVK